MARDQFEETFGKGRGRSTVQDENERLRLRVYELECALADERAEPRPGEDFRLVPAGGGVGGSSFWAEDRETKVLVRSQGHTSEKGARNTAMYLLREALLPENIDVGWPTKGSMHSSICSCRACGQGGIMPEDDDDPEDASA